MAVIGTILWAQWLSIRNVRGTAWTGRIVTGITSLLWYGLWISMAYGAYQFAALPEARSTVRLGLPRGLLFVVGYWQFTPLLVASLGASLDLKKLLVYPVPPSRLFWVEVLLRLSTGVEMLILLAGTFIGLVVNPQYGGVLAFLRVFPPFIIFILANLFMAAGIRNVLERLLGRKHIRELFVVVAVMAAALPQLLIVSGVSGAGMRHWFQQEPWRLLPSTAVSRLALDGPSILDWGILIAWTLATYWFGRWQFYESLKYDAQAAQSGMVSTRSGSSLAERLLRLPGYLLPDPLSAIVEKELRTLARTPRFRLVFIMGFTFGILVWLPATLGESRSNLFVRHFLTFVSIYALMLLGQVSFWNAFGFDRHATLFYYAVPVRVSVSLIAKNIAAALFVILEIVTVTAACLLLRMRLDTTQVVEAFTVTVILSLYLFAAGNLASVYLPRGINPERVGRGASSSFSQALVLLVFPVAGFPLLLAYLGRYAFESDLVFGALLGFAALLGVMVYWIALDSAVEAADRRREKIIGELSRSDGPVATS